jgi:hypothetical protein
MNQEHSFKGTENLLYARRYIGEGRYYQRGLCKGISVGDEFSSYIGGVLIVDKIISVADSNGKFKNPEDGKNALYEAELVDTNYSDKYYQPLPSV